jgi:hypothetical protein
MNEESELSWEQIKQATDRIIFAHTGEHLKDVEILVLQSSWEGLTYEAMAGVHFLAVNYLRGDVGPTLWQKLSDALGETLTKKNFKNALQRATQRQLLLSSVNSINSAIATSNTSSSHTSETVSPNPTSFTPPFPEGSVPLDSPLYLEREGVDQLCYDMMMRSGALLRIKAPKQMGKTSLITRILAHGKVNQYKTVYIDLKSVERSIISNLDKFLRWLCVIVGRQLELENCLKDYWDTEILGSNDNCTVYFEEYLLAEIDCPLVLALDSVDRLFVYSEVVEDVLGMLRSWHEKGKTTHRWRQLRLVLAHSTESYIPLDINQSPFNAGVPIELLEFNISQIFKLATIYSLDWHQSQIEKLMAMVGGHPYLISLALYAIATERLTLAQLLSEAPTETGIYQAHLYQQIQTLKQVPLLADALKKVVLSPEPVTLDSMQIYKLHSMGLVLQQNTQVIPRCQLYREYFRRVL